MSEGAASILIWSLLVYLGLGTAFWVAFASVGMGRLDPAAQHASWGFRILVGPGVVALWPVLLAKWVRLSRHPSEVQP